MTFIYSLGSRWGNLLLWSVLERYTALRYHLAGKVMGKVEPLAQEQAFVDGLRQNVREERTVYRADDPGENAAFELEVRSQRLPQVLLSSTIQRDASWEGGGPRLSSSPSERARATRDHQARR